MRPMIRAAGAVAAALAGAGAHAVLPWLDAEVQLALAGIAGYVGGSLAASIVDAAWRSRRAQRALREWAEL